MLLNASVRQKSGVNDAMVCNDLILRERKLLLFQHS